MYHINKYVNMYCSNPTRYQKYLINWYAKPVASAGKKRKASTSEKQQSYNLVCQAHSIYKHHPHPLHFNGFACVLLIFNF